MDSVDFKAMLLLLAVRYPDCDRTTGEFIEKCWNTVAIDTPCHPDSAVNG